MKSEFQAELLGLHTGDGTLYNVSKTIVWELRGGLDEQDFYNNHVKKLLQELFGDTLIPKFRSGGKNGCYGFQTTNKKVISFLLSSGFTPGPKSKTASIPENILTGTLRKKAAFLRGLFATDGTIYLAKTNGKTKRTYPMIELASASVVLRNQTQAILRQFGLESYIWTYTPKRRGGPCYFLRLAGKAKTERFIKQIGFCNPKHQRVVEKVQNL